MGLVWIDVRRDAPASRALRLAPEESAPPYGPTGGWKPWTRRPSPGSVYRQYLNGLARIHQKGKR